MADSKRVRMSKREGALMARLSAKEQEVYEVQASARDLYRARRPVTDFARQVYTDPAINVEFQLLTAQLAEMENSLRLKEAELKELRTTADKADKDKGTGAAAKGTGAAGKPPPAGGTGSNSGASARGESTVARASALVARCQRLEQENEELAASADVAKVAQLTSEKAVAEAYAGELKTALEEAYEYIEKLEEEREVHSTKVYALEEELRSVASQPRLHGQQQQQQQQPQQGHEQQQQQEQQQQHHEQQHQQHHQQQQQHQHQDHHDPNQHQQHHHLQQQQDYRAAPQQRGLGAASSVSDMQQQSSPSSRDDKSSWNEAVQQQHHHHHGGQGEQRQGQGSEGEIGRRDHDDGGDSRPGLHDAPGPPPPSPPAAALETAATEDDMDDLYGDMGDAVGQAFEPAEGQEGAGAGASAGGDPMEEEETQEQEQERRREETPPPVATRARSTRRSTRSRK